MAVSFKTIRPLFQTGTGTGSRILSYIGLGIGVLLLLCSAQMFVNIQQLVRTNAVQKGGHDFISITKKVTNATMGQPEKNLFQPNELDELNRQPFIDSAAPLRSNEFRVVLSTGMLPVSADIFLETIDHHFLDTLPQGFDWKEGQQDLPLIISSDFLEAYNVFAPGQGLPQFSRSTISSLPLLLTCSGKGRQVTFTARVVGFSDRIANTVLVPTPFLEWANGQLAEFPKKGNSRVYLKTKDANNPDLLKFLEDRGYYTNRDRTLFGRSKQVLQGIFSGLGIFGLLVVLLALMLFSFYLQLVIARSRDSLQLLLTLGYSPRWLSRKVSGRFVPVYVIIVLSALAVTQAIQWVFHKKVMYDRPELQTAVHLSIPALAVLLIVISVIANYSLVKRLVSKMV